MNRGMEAGRKKRALIWGGIVTCAHWSLYFVYLAVSSLHDLKAIAFGPVITPVRLLGKALYFPLVYVLWSFSKLGNVVDLLYFPVLLINGCLWGAIASVIALWVSKPTVRGALQTSEQRNAVASSRGTFTRE